MSEASSYRVTQLLVVPVSLSRFKSTAIGNGVVDVSDKSENPLQKIQQHFLCESSQMAFRLTCDGQEKEQQY